MTRAIRRAVFLDRDGVLNRAELRDGRPVPPSRPEDVVVLPGVPEACRRLAGAGWTLFVVTNQPDIARGRTTRDVVDAINAVVTAALPVSEVLVCPHDDDDRCACRKPRPGLLHDAARRWDVDLSESVIVGDRWRDVDAGHAAGVRTIFVDRGYPESLRTAPDVVVTSLTDAADHLLDADRAATVPEDDWESHWSEFSEAVRANPAQEYRRAIVTAAIERAGGPPARLLDVGSGQGDLLHTLRARWPAAELAGLEQSAEGVRRGRDRVPSARFFQVDLLGAVVPSELTAWADVAVCSEVLEHVDDPVRLLRNACRCIAPGGLLVVTVPGGPRTAFDRFIGHRRHFRPALLGDVLEQAGLDVQRVRGTGFPFFNCYKLVVLAQGKALVRATSSAHPPSRLANAAMRGFGVVLTPRFNSSRVGWQLVAETRTPALTGSPRAGTIAG